MTQVICPHCGTEAFTIAGWADLDRCSNCGRHLGGQAPTYDELLAARQRLRKRRGRQQRGVPLRGQRRSRS